MQLITIPAETIITICVAIFLLMAIFWRYKNKGKKRKM